MCLGGSPKMPELPKPQPLPEPPPPAPAPPPMKEPEMPLPPPQAVTGKDDKVALKKKNTKSDQLQQAASGTSPLTNPLSIPGATGGSGGSLNIPT